MANIFRIKTTRKLPLNAELIQKKSGLFVRIKRNGRTVLREVTECGKRYRDESRKWYIQYKDQNGQWKRVAGFSDKEATNQLAAKLERSVERKHAGLSDPLDVHTQRPLAEHLEEFRTYLAGKNNSPKHVDQTCGRIQRLFDGCNFEYWKDISASGVVTWLSAERAADRFGIKTSNYYQAAAKEFCSWMVKDGRASTSPLAHLSAINAKADVRRKRRALTDEEFEWLIRAALNGPPVQCVEGTDRAMLYMVAVWTGYRRNELASITRGSLDFESSSPTASVTAAYSKRRRDDTIPLHAEVAERLQAWLANKELLHPSTPIFPLKTAGGRLRRTSKMMELDLKAARAEWIAAAKDVEERTRRESSDFLQYCNDDGSFADFHANRHTFISKLVKTGVGVKLAQVLARHSTPELTMNVYSHVDASDQSEAINKMDGPPPVDGPPTTEQSSEAVAQKLNWLAQLPDPYLTMYPYAHVDAAEPSDAINKMDGPSPMERLSTTEHRSTAAEAVAQGVAQEFDAACLQMSTLDVGWLAGPAEVSESKPLPIQGLGVDCHPLSTDDQSSGGGTRTPDTRIMIPLL